MLIVFSPLRYNHIFPQNTAIFGHTQLLILCSASWNKNVFYKRSKHVWTKDFSASFFLAIFFISKQYLFFCLCKGEQMWHRNLDHHSRIMAERICVCVYVPLDLIYSIWDRAMCLRAARRLIKVWSLFSSCFISSLQWIWVHFPWTWFLRECQREFI